MGADTNDCATVDVFVITAKEMMMMMIMMMVTVVVIHCRGASGDHTVEVELRFRRKTGTTILEARRFHDFEDV